MNIKKNDKVIVLAGKDKGKIGKVLQILTETDRASVEGLNLLIKHMRSGKKGEAGQRIEFPAPIRLSNLMLVCPKCEKPTRIGRKLLEPVAGSAARKVRVCKKCEATID